MTDTYLATQNIIKIQQPDIEVDPGSGSFATGFPPENALDGLTWTRTIDSNAFGFFTLDLDFTNFTDTSAWDFDCWGIAGHKLHRDTSGNAFVRILYSDNGTNWTQWDGPYTPLTASAVFVAGLSVQRHRYWRYTLYTEQLPAEVAVLWLGRATLMEQAVGPPFSPPGYDQNNRLLQNFGGGGQLLGTGILRQGGRTTYQFNQLTWDFWESVEVYRHYERMVEGEPFMLAWDNTGHREQAAYGVAPTNPNVQYLSHGRVNVSIDAFTL